jgi:hypothetical protein
LSRSTTGCATCATAPWRIARRRNCGSAFHGSPKTTWKSPHSATRPPAQTPALDRGWRQARRQQGTEHGQGARVLSHQCD